MLKGMASLLTKLKPTRRWLQVSLRTMLVAVALLSIILSLWIVPAERQRRTVAAIYATGGFVDYIPLLALIQDSGVTDPRESETFPKTFLRRWLPPDYFDDVLQAHLPKTRLTEAGLNHLLALTSLQTLGLGDTQNTDAGLNHLRGLLPGLQQLYLGGSQVTDAGLAHLQGLTGLQDLSLGSTQVTDAGLTNLQGLTGLQQLTLNNTQVSDAGVAQLRALTSLRGLRLDNTQITDVGLARLQVLTDLRFIDLTKTRVTAAGVAKFRQALPKCKIRGP
ncbi:MAG TPA: hypothetical protein VHC22_13065 [Pirellulales bacterium]|nr:hypothetical protein [Pirellulales bacterium]